MTIDNKECEICFKKVDEINKYLLNNNGICKNCNICTICCKKYYSNKKNKDICKKCSHKCKTCKKIMLKNNWPGRKNI